VHKPKSNLRANLGSASSNGRKSNAAMENVRNWLSAWIVALRGLPSSNEISPK
jgi:hypothetical protein